MPKTNAENVKTHYDRNKEDVLKRKRDRYHAKKLKKSQEIKEEVELTNTSELIPVVEIKEPELDSKTEFIEIIAKKDPIDTFEITKKMIYDLPNESAGNKLFRSKNLKTIINIIKPNDYDDLIFKFTKQPKKVIKLIKNYEYIKGRTYSTNTLISLYKAILFFIDKFSIFIKPDKKTKYEDAIQIGDIVSSKELIEKNNSNDIPSFEDYLQKLIKMFGNKSREYLIAKMYSEIKCRDDLHLILVDSFDNLDSQKNYLVLNDNKSSVVINDYKTIDKYGRYDVELSNELTTLISDYILEYEIKNGEKFFNFNNVSMVISRMNKILGFTKLGNINLFRKMIASDAKDLPLKEQLKVAKQMKHSLKVHNSNYIIKEII